MFFFLLKFSCVDETSKHARKEDFCVIKLLAFEFRVFVCFPTVFWSIDLGRDRIRICHRFACIMFQLEKHYFLSNINYIASKMIINEVPSNFVQNEIPMETVFKVPKSTKQCNVITTFFFLHPHKMFFFFDLLTKQFFSLIFVRWNIKCSQNKMNFRCSSFSLDRHFQAKYTTSTIASKQFVTLCNFFYMMQRHDIWVSVGFEWLFLIRFVKKGLVTRKN